MTDDRNSVSASPAVAPSSFAGRHPSDVVTLAEAAQLLRLSESSIKHLVARGALARMGDVRRLRFRVATLAAFVEAASPAAPEPSVDERAKRIYGRCFGPLVNEANRRRFTAEAQRTRRDPHHQGTKNAKGEMASAG